MSDHRPESGAASPAGRCPVCNARYDGDRKFCPKDGAALRRRADRGPLIGALIADRYLVREWLGRGGTGSVYRAERIGIGEACAVKVVHAEVADDSTVVARFHREALNASRLVHPNVASTFDFGRTPDGRLFLAMEFVDGETLSAVLARDGPLAPPRAVEIARQIADALRAAEEAGVVHRDLKPDNVMLTRRRDGSELVKVVDFGIAKAVRGGGQTVTATGMVVGTPSYMSPEQLAGDPALDARSDQYALGLIVHEMLTGQRAFPARTFGAAARRLTTPAPRLSVANPRVAWPPGAQDALDEALAVDSARRHASAAEFARRLADAFRERPGAAAPAAGAPPSATRAAPRSGRRRLVTAAVLAALAALAVGVAGGVWSWSRARAAPPLPGPTGGAPMAPGPRSPAGGSAAAAPSAIAPPARGVER